MIDQAYDSLFGGVAGEQRATRTPMRSVPADKLHSFFTAKINFRKYSECDLQALADDIAANEILEYIKVRQMQNRDYEILSGHNRIAACRLLGWTQIPVEVEQADDNRAITIATVTNLKRRQGLLPSERGWAYRALLEAQKQQGRRTDLEEPTCGQIAHRTKTRDKVAAYFGVEVTKLHRDIQLTYLIPELLEAVENKQLKIGSGTIISHYDGDTQSFILKLLQKDGWNISLAAMQQICKTCPAPKVTETALQEAWDYSMMHVNTAHASNKSIVFQRKQFEPYLIKLGDEKALEAFLRIYKRTMWLTYD